MGKQAVIAALHAQGLDLRTRLAPLSERDWRRPLPEGSTARSVVAWLAEQDRHLASGRLAPLVDPLPSEDSSAVPVGDLTAVADEARVRLLVRLRHLPAPAWYLSRDVGDGLRRTVGSLLRRRVLREHVATWPLGRSGTPPALDPAVAGVLARSALERLPGEVLPHTAVRVGVVRLEVVERPDGPFVHAWGLDFSRKHYGPRVTGRPDALVRVSSSALARMLEGRADWSALPDHELVVEGDRELAGALLEAFGVGSRPPAR